MNTLFWLYLIFIRYVEVSVKIVIYRENGSVTSSSPGDVNGRAWEAI